MPYSTETTIPLLLPGLPSSSGATGFTRIQAHIVLHINRADALINSKIATRYDVSGFDTTGSVPPLVRQLSEDITSFYTYRSQFSGDNQNINEWIEKFDSAMEDLDKIRDGDMDLVSTAGSLIGERSATAVELVSSNTKTFAPFFGEDSVTAWEVDEDKLTAIKDSRD